MAEVRRFGGKTYGKSPNEDSAASKAFDEVFAKPKQAKWGNVSYVKQRDDGKNSEKEQLQEEDKDPFSFETDTDRSPKKRQPKPSRTVVLQPAVRMTPPLTKSPGKPSSVKSELDDNVDDEFTVKKVNVQTYSKSSGRKIRTESPDVTVVKDEKISKREKDSTLVVPKNTESVDLDDADEGLYIEPDDGSSNASEIPAECIITKVEENIFNRPRKYTSQNVTNKDGDEVMVRFRSQYLNPEVYSKFTENIQPKDPVGSLSNSKVVHKNVLKHDSGTTLIVVCSPKVADSEIKQSNTQSKYFKNNVKDLAKSKNKPVEKLTKNKRGSKTPDKDPFEMDEDTKETTNSKDNSSVKEESESPIPSSSDIEKSSQETYTTRSGRVKKHVHYEEPKEEPIDVDDIVTKVKTAPPRKYHKIFRSRNKGYMDPNAEPETPSPPIKAPDIPKAVMPKTQKKGKAPAVNQPNSIESPKSNGELPAEAFKNEVLETETAMEVETPQPSSQETDEAVIKSEEVTESDIDSSQTTSVADSQETEAEISSQEFTEPQPKKARMVKTPPAERKIFRARGTKSESAGAQKKIFSSPKKAAAVYNVRSWQDNEEGMAMPDISDASVGMTDMSPPAPPEPPKLKPAVKKAVSLPARVSQPEMPRLTRAVHWQKHDDDDAYTSVHVSKEHKDLFTVVKNVKEAHECQEHGETQEFDDDIEYLLAGIESIEPMSTRCLSCVGLAQKCTIPAFRMHLRAHGTVTKIFGCLQDAASDPSLALCTSALMFMLSRDRLNMDLDQESLNLMLRLLGVDQQEDMATTLSSTAERALKRNKDRVLEVYKEFLQQSGTKQELDIECLSTGNLAMESLLSLTSRRAGEWFKEELRTLGALDHIVDTVCSCIEAIGVNVSVLTNSNIENLKKVDRCLRVMENVTYMNADNQNYLIAYKDSVLIPSLVRSLGASRVCLAIYPLVEDPQSHKVDKESFGWVIYSCILAVLRVLLNLTHDNDTGCTKIGEQSSAIETVLLCILTLPQHIPVDLRFDLYVLALGLLINLVEHSDGNRVALLTMKTQCMYEQDSNSDSQMLAYLSLVEVFKKREEAAQNLEEADEPKTPETSPNKSGEWRESDSGMEWIVDSAKKSSARKPGRPGDDNKEKDLEDEETFTKALHKAGKHMENSIVAAYVALLVGCLIQDNQECKDTIKSRLPDNKFDGMIFMLKKFLGFMNLTSGTESAGGKSIQRVIEILET
ncbi:wings apart-like protein homolog [Dreissena polymorpha]|uniref:WAPL domain-containing protein n=1 Tax=Dreissena polymorpha TaxID=45954 RepID=A0A9D4LMG9_DREPO|nr:wings apart-like protein homolog [Dreissena polymorpha]KAH3861515.1 hypothetical protein DPMN_024445 [Dreissena polymorpha]